VATYLGDYTANSTVYFLWGTNSAEGASVSRTFPGTIRVYKNITESYTLAGITDLEDFDSITGIHACAIDTSSDAFYTTGQDYHVVIVDVEVDGVPNINAVLAEFSIQNRN
jgi:hypothetical protein